MQQQTLPAVGERRSARALRPAVGLVGGLVLVANIVATHGRLSPHALDARFGVNSGIFPVGDATATYPEDLAISPFETAIAHRWWVLTLVLALAYCGATAALGRPIVAAVRGEDRWPVAISALAGFIPGFVLLLGPLQLLYAAVPTETASWIALAGTVAAALLVNRDAVRASPTVLRARAARAGVGWGVAGAFALVLIAVVHRLQVDAAFLTQDSIHWYLLVGAQQLDGSLGSYLVQWAHQSDEWVFNAPLMFSSSHAGDLWLPIYLTQCVGLASFAALVFGLTHRAAQRRKALAGWLAVAAVFATTMSIYPWMYVKNIAGGQPLYEMGHPGRLIAIVAPWMALLLVRRHPRGTTIALVLATIGCAFLSANVLPQVAAAIVLALAWQALRGGRVPSLRLRVATHLAPAVSLGLCAIAFWAIHVLSDPSQAAWLLVASVVVALAGAVAVAAVTERGDAPSLPGRAWLGVWPAVTIAGVLLSNNLIGKTNFDDAIRRGIAHVLPGFGGEILQRPDLGDGMFSMVSFPDLSESACLVYLQCQGFADFVACYGVLIVLAGAIWAVLGPITSDAVVNLRRAIFLVLVASLSAGMLVIFFTGGKPPTGDWPYQPLIASRLVELPTYGLLVLAAIAFAESRNRWTLFVCTGVLVTWTVVPFVALQRPEELVRNAGWYLERLGVL
ncbi:hypothetical protein [Baekduia sp. Peel2402]|uniref:hypothetical protein n=1 Tax=Baekduia sp. Peel2402 TaxID=3458296 RepID=UPI00403E6F62